METLQNIGQWVKSKGTCALGIARRPIRWCNTHPRIFGGPLTRTGITEIDALWEETDGTDGQDPVQAVDSETTLSSPPRGNKNQPGTSEGKQGLTWLQTAFLMTGEFVGTSTHTFPHVFATLGFLPTLFTLLAIVATYWYTCKTVWMAKLRYPAAKNICELGVALFGKAWLYWVTFTLVQTCYLLIMAVHIRGTVEILEVTTLTVPTCASVIMSVIAGLICYAVTLPRHFSFLATFSAFSVFTTLASAITAAISLRLNGPLSKSSLDDFKFPDGEMREKDTFAWGSATATLSQKVEAMLLIVFAYLGQPTIPTIMDDMRDDRDFPKALIGSLFIQTAVFSVYGALAYHFVGVGDMTSPVIRSLQGKTAIICAVLMMPATISQGALFASVDGRMLCDLLKFEEKFPSVKGEIRKKAKRYSVWAGILAALWFVGGLITQCVPNFTGLLSIVAAIPGSFFFFVYGGMAWFVMRKYNRKHDVNAPTSRTMDMITVIINGLIIVIGVVACLGLGSWASVNTYISAIEKGQAQKPFSCQPVAAIKKPEKLPESANSTTTLDPAATEQPVNEKIWGEDEFAPLAVSVIATEPEAMETVSATSTETSSEEHVSEETGGETATATNEYEPTTTSTSGPTTSEAEE